ncbi:hypothetical protein [Ferrovibrio sp.]|uniref:hypothetical protein n=1 Tax=Ferrovibrio sp. TaxID=1917215 RepID=UPI0031201236
MIGNRIPNRFLLPVAMAGLVGLGLAASATAKPLLRPEPPRIAAPAYAVKTKRQSRKITERQQRKARRRTASIARHQAGAEARARTALRCDPKAEELQAVINAMTNHERHLWSRYCGQDRAKRRDIAVARRFQNPYST